MGALDQINNFELPSIIYVLIFLAIGLGTTLAVVLIWTLNRGITRIKYPPKLRIKQTIIKAFVPPVMGTIMATLPVLLMIIIIKEAQVPIFSAIPYSYDPGSYSDE